MWILVLLVAACVARPAPAPDCGGRTRIFLSIHPLLDAETGGGFADSLRGQLRGPLSALGYCLDNFAGDRARPDTVAVSDNLILHVLAREATGSGVLVVAALTVRDWSAGKLPEAVERPLASLRFNAAEISALPAIAARKIVENLRTQYVAQLLIQSWPPGAAVRSGAGMRGSTPVEWVVPLGIFPVTLEKPGYLPVRRDLDLQNPGMHTFEVQMARRRFYHSKFIYPALAFGAATGAAFYLENLYYSRYRNLGAQDQREHPGRFAETFHRAKDFERLGLGCLALTAATLAFSFRF